MLGPAQPIRFATVARGALAVALAAAAFVVAVPSSAEAIPVPVTVTVTTTSDVTPNTDPCTNDSVLTIPQPVSLREASCLADNLGGSVTVSIPSGTYQLTRGELSSGRQAGQHVSFVGSGASSTVIDAGGLSRVFNLDANGAGGISTTISNLTITGGADSQFGGAGIIGGSGDSAQPDSLTLDTVVVKGNHANAATPDASNQPGGGVQFVGGALHVTNSTFSNDTSSSSAGAAIAYEASSHTPASQLSIDGSMFSNDDTTNSSTGNAVSNGGALSFRGVAGGTSTISNSRFVDNTVTATTGPAIGGAIWSQSGTLNISTSTFTGNSAAGGAGTPTGGAIGVDGGTLSIDHSRLVGNTAANGGALGVGNAAPVTATENWWGCNAGPGSTGCDTVAGTTQTTPRLVLSASASPAEFASPDTTSMISAFLTTDSAGTAVPATSLTAFTGLSIGFAAPAGGAEVGGSPGAKSSTLSNGAATIGFDSEGSTGTNSVAVSLDGQTVQASLTSYGSLIVSPDGDPTIAVGAPFTYHIRTSGVPATGVSITPALPDGLSASTAFANGNATLTVTGTPTEQAVGVHNFTTTATDIFNHTATTGFSITIADPVTITGPTSATFTVGQPEIVTEVISNVDAQRAVLEKSGRLPSGVDYAYSYVSANQAKLIISGTPAAGTGGTYPVTFTIASEPQPYTSLSFTLTVVEAPTVTTQPVDQRVTPGTAVTFSAAADGSPTPTVQWQRDTGSGFQDIPGATSTDYSFTTTTTSDDDTVYQAVFTNTAGTTTSDPATLHVGIAPSFTGPTTGTFSVGHAGSVTITADGTPAPSGITRTSGVLPDGLTFTTDPLGGPTATLAGTPAAGTAGTYTLTLTATNGFTPDATETFTVTVNQAPRVTTQPADQTVTPGTAVTFTAAADGSPAPTVQWQRNTGSGFQDIPGATSTDYLLTTFADTAEDNSRYRAVFTNVAGIAASDPATLRVGIAPTFSGPTTGTFTVGHAGSVTITTDGTPAPSRITRTSGVLPDGLTFTTDPLGGPTATLAGTPAAGTVGTYTLTLAATNGFTPDATETFTITVNEAPTVSTQPVAQTVTPGTAVTFTATATGSPTPTVQWQRDTGSGFRNIPGATSTDYTFTTAATDDNTSYQAVFTSAAGTATSNPATLRVGIAPSFTGPTSGTFTVGHAGSVTITADGTPAPTSITRTAGDLPTGLTLTTAGATATLAGTPAAGTVGTYTLTLAATNGFTPDATETFTLTVNQAPSVTTQPLSQTVTPGTAVTFSAAADGSPTPTIQWQRNNGSGFETIPGATGTDYSFTTAATDDDTAYHAVFTNAAGTVTSDPATLRVGIAPSFTGPTTGTFTVGHAGSVTITTSGTPAPSSITRTAGDLPTGLTLTTAGATATLAGTPAAGTAGTYTLTFAATNGFAPDATETFALTVNQAPTVTTQPADKTVTPGTAVTFTAAADGSPAPTVQWQRNTGSGFRNIPGATNTDYSFTTAATDDDSTYQAVFTNVAGTATTTAATLHVGIAPSFSGPTSGTFTVGHAGSVTITADGTPAPTGITRTSGVLPAGVTLTTAGATATVSGTPAAGTAGTYTLTLATTNGFTPDATETFTLTVNEAPTVSTQPLALTVTPGTAVTFTATATGSPTPTIQWQRDTGSGFRDIPGATSTDYTFTTAATDDNTSYQAVFTNAAGTATTTAATLRVGIAPSFTGPSTGTFTVGHAGSVTITADGTPAPSSITRTSGVLPAGVTLTTDPLGGPTATLAGTPAAGTAGTYTLTLATTNGFTPDATETFTLTVNESPTVTTQPVAQTVTPGTGVTFTATAAGSPTPTIQWQRDTGSGFQNIPGATSTDYTLTTTTTADDNTSYQAVFTNTAGTVTSDPATLHVGTTPTFAGPPQPTQRFIVGQPGVITITAAGTPAPTLSVDSATPLPAWLTFTFTAAHPATALHLGHGFRLAAATSTLATATLSGTPPQGSAGHYVIRILATSDIGTAVAETVTIDVASAASGSSGATPVPPRSSATPSTPPAPSHPDAAAGAILAFTGSLVNPFVALGGSLLVILGGFALALVPRRRRMMQDLDETK